MPEDPLDTAKQYINATIDDVDDRDVRFKLRTASQLLDAADLHDEDTVELIEDSE